MTRWLSVAVLVAVAAAAVIMPLPADPDSGPAAQHDPPAVAVCTIEEGSGRSTEFGVVATVNGSGRMTAFAGGLPVGSVDFVTGASGSTSVDGASIAAVGVAGVLAELPDAATAVGTVVSGDESLAAETCAAGPFSQTVLAGGSTLTGESLQLQLVNPYSGEAVVALTAVSDIGIEANEALSSVTVPPQSSVVIDLANLLPGRSMLSIIIETVRGGVVSAGRFSSGADIAIWNASPAAEDWFLPVPAGRNRRAVVVASASAAEVSYQVDVYGPDGLEEGLIEGSIPGRGFATIDIGEVARSAVAIRVITTGPVVPFLRLEPLQGVGITAGSALPATRWLMPGANSTRDGVTSVFLLNPGTEDATVVVAERREATTALEFVVPADSMVVHQLTDMPSEGISVESDRLLIASWLMRAGSGAALSSGIAITDG